jgi:putative membrane protein insertion efficiency factor
MSPLRKLLKHPATYLAILVLLVAAAYADSLQPSDRQLTSRAYIAVVRGYQSVGSPVLASFVQCRYRPTCSRYSIETVRRYGLRRGLALTAARLWRCRRTVPLGTADPVP